MADIIQDPIKLVMLIILLVLEIPAAICLAVMWRKAFKEARERERENEFH